MSSRTVPSRPQQQGDTPRRARSETEGGAGACLPVIGTPAPRGSTVVPESLAGLLGEFRGCFTAPSFAVFCVLATGFLAQAGRRTVCGMLVGARLSRLWSHHR